MLLLVIYNPIYIVGLFNQKKSRLPKLILKEVDSGFSTNEMVVVLASIGILATMILPNLMPVVEIAEVLIAEKYLLGAVKECQMGLINGEDYPIYTLPPQSVGIGFISTRRFKFPDSGDDGDCLSFSSGNILSAVRTSRDKIVPLYNLNINLVTGEKTTEGEVPSWLDWWEGVYSPLIQENDPLLQ